MPMKISIAVPIYHGEKYLQEMLESIQNQTRLPDELVMSDDGSTDSTLKIARQFAEKAPFKVKVLRQEHSGITANYLNALRATNGDVIIFSDQDDIWLTKKIKLIENYFVNRQQTAIVSSDSELVDQGLHPFGTTLRGGKIKSAQLARTINLGDDYLHFLKGLPLLAHTLAIRSSFKTDLLNKPEQPAGWWFESWVANIALCHGRLALIPEALTLYRQHSGQAAGAPSVAKPVKISAVVVYKKRIEKLRYCRQMMQRNNTRPLFSQSEQNYRIQKANSYIQFLKKRVALRKSFVRRVVTSASLLFTGNYHRFSRGWLSFAKDFLFN